MLLQIRNRFQITSKTIIIYFVRQNTGPHFGFINLNFEPLIPNSVIYTPSQNFEVNPIGNIFNLSF